MAVKSTAPKVSKKSKKSKYVIIRTYSAGVHAGELVSRKGQEVVLKNTRRIWYWKGSASLSQMAVSGVNCPNECRFSVVAPEVVLTQAIEVLQCTKEAEKNIKEVPVWKI